MFPLFNGASDNSYLGVKNLTDIFISLRCSDWAIWAIMLADTVVLYSVASKMTPFYTHQGAGPGPDC